MATEATAQLNILVKLRDEASASMQRLSNEVSDLGGNLGFSGEKAGILAGALSAIAGAAIVSSVNAFADAEAQMASFDALMATMPPHLQALKGQILSVADEALEKFGFDNEEAAMSMAKLLKATGSGTLTFQAFQAAMDLARLKGISLDQATKSIILAFQGNTRALKEYGIEVDEHASKETILAAIMGVARGQAEAYSETLNGQREIMRQYGQEVQEALGEQYAGVLGLVGEGIRGWIREQGGINKLMQDFNRFMPVVAGMLTGIFVGGLVLATASLLAMAGPFGVVIAGLAAIIGVATLLYTLWKLYWPEIQAVVVNTLAMLAGPIGMFAKYAVDNWDLIKTRFITAFTAIKEFLVGVGESIKSTIQSTLSWVVEKVNTVIRAMNSFGKVGSKLGISIPSLPTIPQLATGGIVTSPTLAMIGEAGPEAVVPLSRMGSFGGGMVVNNYIQGDVYGGDEVAERLGDSFARLIKNQVNLGGIRA